jgi:hypothetical protein
MTLPNAQMFLFKTLLQETPPVTKFKVDFLFEQIAAGV